MILSRALELLKSRVFFIFHNQIFVVFLDLTYLNTIVKIKIATEFKIEN